MSSEGRTEYEPFWAMDTAHEAVHPAQTPAHLDRGGPLMSTTIIKKHPWTLDVLDLPETTLVKLYREDDEFRPSVLVDVFEVDEPGRRALLATGADTAPCARCHRPFCRCAPIDATQ